MVRCSCGAAVSVHTQSGGSSNSIAVSCGVLRRTGGEEFDVANAARWELDWWQLRRENVGAKQYGLIIAQNTSAIFHVDGPDILTAGLLRADAMQYRDEHGRGDWRGQVRASENRNSARG